MTAPTVHRLHGVEVLEEGQRGPGVPTVMLLHGWPDTHRLWDALVAVLAPSHRCLRFTWPGFEPGARRPMGLDALVELQRLLVQDLNGGQPLTLIAHDWGSRFGAEFAMRHPALVQRLVLVDVGDAGSGAHVRELPLKARIGLVAYQWALVAAWRLPAALGDPITRQMARWLHAPTPQAAHAGMDYPYDITWLGTHGGYRHARRLEPHCPTLFVYGQRKPFMFHSQRWADALARQPGCRVVALPAGHWLMSRRPEAFHEAVLGWLQGREPAGP